MQPISKDPSASYVSLLSNQQHSDIYISLNCPPIGRGGATGTYDEKAGFKVVVAENNSEDSTSVIT